MPPILDGPIWPHLRAQRARVNDLQDTDFHLIAALTTSGCTVGLLSHHKVTSARVTFELMAKIAFVFAPLRNVRDDSQ